MTQNDKIEIYPSKIKTLMTFGFALFFVLMGMYFVSISYHYNIQGFYHYVFAFLFVPVGIVAILLGGLGMLSCLITLFFNTWNHRPIIIIDDQGITQQPSFSILRKNEKLFIPWNKITRIDCYSVSQIEFIGIFIENPNEYVANQKSAVTRYFMRKMLERHGTPISLPPPSMINMDYHQLKNSLIAYHKKYAGNLVTDKQATQTPASSIEIPFNKSLRISHNLMLPFAYVLAIGGLLSIPNIFSDPNLRPALYIGIIPALFILMYGPYYLKKAFDKKPALMINQQGITDNSSIFSLGLIPWNEIIRINFSQNGLIKYIIIFIENPRQRITDERNIFKRIPLYIKFLRFGSPIRIYGNLLEFGFSDLQNILDSKFAMYKKSKS